jgi:NitT/TauT family transport system ATP-binding protein
MTEVRTQSTVGSLPMLEVRNLSKSFGTLDVFKDVNLTLEPGKFLSLIGPSGCGKTTLLRIVAGLESNDAGTVYVDGEVSTGPAPGKSFVFQHFSLFPWRTVIDNAAYGLEMRGESRDERHAKAGRFLERLGLGAFHDYYPSQLSGGMQQRVGIARALAVDPELVLMDEPFGALDALTRERLQHELEGVCEVGGMTVLFVTHSIDEALFLSDTIAVMGTNPGRIVRRIEVPFGRPRRTIDLRSDPAYAELRNEIWSLLSPDAPRRESWTDRD